MEKRARPAYRGRPDRREKRVSLAYTDNLDRKVQWAKPALRDRRDHKEKRGSLVHKAHRRQRVSPRTRHASTYSSVA